MKRRFAITVVTAALLSLLVVTSSTFSQPGHLSPQGGTITSVQPTSGGGLAGGGTGGAVHLGLLTSCGSGQILKWNGSSWGCSADTGGFDTAGSGVAGSGSTIAIDPTYTQRRVTGTCASPNAIRVVNQDGTATCTTGVLSTSNLSGTTNTILKITGTNTAGNSGWTDSGTATTYLNKFVVDNFGDATGSGDYSFANGALSGNSTVNGTTTGSGAATYKAGLTVWGAFAGSGSISLGDASADSIAFNGSASTALNMNTHTIVGVVDPTNGQDAATKHYVDSVAVAGAVAGSTNQVARFTAANAIGNAQLSDNGTATTLNENQPGISYDSTTLATPSAFVTAFAPPSGVDTVVMSVVSTNTLITGIVVPTTTNRHIRIVNSGANCFSAYDDNTNSTITRRLNLPIASTGFGFVCPHGYLDCFYDPNLGAVTPGRWSCTFGWASQSPTSVTINGALTASGNINSSAAIGAAQYMAASQQVYAFNNTVLETDGILFGNSINAASTGYINKAGYQEGITQFRNLEIDDGKGSGSSHYIASFDAASHNVGFSGRIDAPTGNIPEFIDDVMFDGNVEVDSSLTVLGQSSFASQPTGAVGAYGGNHVEQVDEWCGAISGTLTTAHTIGTGWVLQFVGTGSGLTTYTVSAGRPCILAMTIGVGTANQGVSVNSQATAVNPSDGTWTFESTVRWPTLSTASALSATEYASEIGFLSTPQNKTQADACFFLYDKGNFAGGSNSGNVDALQCVCKESGTGTQTAYLINNTGNSDESFPLGVGTVAANTWYRLKIVWSTTRTEFYRNGTKVCDINTHRPAGSGMGFVHMSNASSGTGARSLEVDQTRWAVDLTSVRSP